MIVAFNGFSPRCRHRGAPLTNLAAFVFGASRQGGLWRAGDVRDKQLPRAIRGDGGKEKGVARAIPAG